MKHAGVRHPKTFDLAQRLSITNYAAVGLLECLWHLAGDYSPRGDIGRLTDGSIARSVGWEREPGLLIDALVASHWLDTDQSHRLIIHDWPEHAFDWIRKRVRDENRSGGGFLPIYSDPYRKSLQVADSVSPVIDQSVTSQTPDIGIGEVRLGEDKLREVGFPKNFEDLPFDTLETPAIKLIKPPLEEWFAEFWEFYWRKVDKANALKAFKKYAVDEEAKDRIVAAVKAQTPQYMARDSEHRPHAATWLNARRYEEDPEVFQPRINGRSSLMEGV